VSTVTLPRSSTTFDRWILQRYAQKFESSSLPPTLLLINTETSLAILDKYPKAIFHFLLLPRIIAGLGFTANDLRNIQTLLEKGKSVEAKMLIQGLKKDAEMVKEMVEKEMLEKHGYKWDVWIGFHAVPSMLYVWER
jgi:aprataxin